MTEPVGDLDQRGRGRAHRLRASGRNEVGATAPAATGTGGSPAPTPAAEHPAAPTSTAASDAEDERPGLATVASVTTGAWTARATDIATDTYRHWEAVRAPGTSSASGTAARPDTTAPIGRNAVAATARTARPSWRQHTRAEKPIATVTAAARSNEQPARQVGLRGPQVGSAAATPARSDAVEAAG